MKNNQTYIRLAGILFLVVLVTMLFQYPRVHFQLHHQGTLTAFDYRAENDLFLVENYFSRATPYSGGATIILKEGASLPDGFSCQVLYEGGSQIHQVTQNEAGHYVLDVVDRKQSGMVPKAIQILDAQGALYASADFIDGQNYLYQAHSEDYAYYNIYANDRGIFMGRFSAFEEQSLISQYDTVMVEFCQIDGSKSDGYRLLARNELGVRDFVNQDVNRWLDFLEEASYDPTSPIEVVLTFQGETSYTLAMTLTEGVA